jgi:imidazoleglycerol-phosphate dehydratase
MMRTVETTRETRETRIKARLILPERSVPEGASRDTSREMKIDTGIPFFDHMLHAFLFHGGFGADVSAKGDIDVDDHHTVEDTGIVLGSLLSMVPEQYGPITRFGHAIIPMDDALAEVVVDACGRSYLAYQVDYPQAYAGRFDLALVREFFTGFSAQARANVHVIGRYGLNGHHLAEAVFKAAGRALGQAYLPAEEVRSTKGVL